jgi:hypothetical protein
MKLIVFFMERYTMRFVSDDAITAGILWFSRYFIILMSILMVITFFWGGYLIFECRIRVPTSAMCTEIREATQHEQMLRAKIPKCVLF